MIANLYDEIDQTRNSRNYRIAWVETNPEIIDIISFTETVLKNRGLPGQLFTNVSDAEEWLLKT